MTSKIEIQGLCEPRFEAVKDAFSWNFAEEMEVGASFAVMINGEYVIDIWGGYKEKEKTHPWEKDTICNVYSTTKVPTVLCTMMCVDRGLLDLDEPVVTYWPEFAQNGKENVLVRHILSHTSGLAGIEEIIPWSAYYDWDKIVNLLAAQKPWWEPGTKSGYHAITHGYLLGELVKRVSGKSLGTFFREEVAEPLNIDFHIGLPETKISRVSNLIPAPPLIEMITLILGNIIKMANNSEIVKKEIENLEKSIEINFVDQRTFWVVTSDNKITFEKEKIENPPDCKFIVAKDKAGAILWLFSTMNEQADFISANLKVEGNSEDIKLIKKLFELIATEVRKMDSPGMKQYLNAIIYEDRSSERSWQAAEIPAANGQGNARSVAKIASVIACEGELDSIRFLSKGIVEKILEEQIYDTDLVMQVPIRYGLGVGLKSKIKQFPNDRTCFWAGAGGSAITMDLDDKIGIGYVMNQMRNQPMLETMSNKYHSDSRGNRLITAVFESLNLI